jgi:molecular chaperone GrpE (heat shock protein)
MTTSEKPVLSLIPFLLADALLLGTSVAIVWLGRRPLSIWEAGLLALTVAAAATSLIYPVLRRYQDALKVSQADALSHAVAQINRMDAVAAQIAQATTQWQTIQENASRIEGSSKDAAKTMASQIAQFSQLLEKANDAEKNQLKLEVDKSRRAEVEWLQVTTRILDHIYALWIGAARTGQKNLIEQIGAFQEACRDTARRVGLIPLLVASGEKFDPQIHQRHNDKDPLPENPVVEITIVTGFSFQGQMIRRPVVAVRSGQATGPTPSLPERGDKISG